MAGSYDNDNGVYIKEDCMMRGHWYRDLDNDALYIVPNDNFGSAEIIGPDDAITERLNEYYRGVKMEDVDTEQVAQSLDLEVIPEVLYRFDEEVGYYTA